MRYFTKDVLPLVLVLAGCVWLWSFFNAGALIPMVKTIGEALLP